MDYENMSTKELLIRLFDLIPASNPPNTTHRINLIQALEAKIDRPITNNIINETKQAAYTVLNKLQSVIK